MRHGSRPTGDLPLSPPCKALLPSCEPRKLWHRAHAAFLESLQPHDRALAGLAGLRLPR